MERSVGVWRLDFHLDLAANGLELACRAQWNPLSQLVLRLVYNNDTVGLHSLNE
jgi:hypothetical protein